MDTLEKELTDARQAGGTENIGRDRTPQRLSAGGTADCAYLSPRWLHGFAERTCRTFDQLLPIAKISRLQLLDAGLSLCAGWPKVVIAWSSRAETLSDPLGKPASCSGPACTRRLLGSCLLAKLVSTVKSSTLKISELCVPAKISSRAAENHQDQLRRGLEAKAVSQPADAPSASFSCTANLRHPECALPAPFIASTYKLCPA